MRKASCGKLIPRPAIEDSTFRITSLEICVVVIAENDDTAAISRQMRWRFRLRSGFVSSKEKPRGHPK
jgi:hypothetical protein